MAEAEARTHMRPWPTHTWTTISTSTYLLLLLLSYSCYYNNNNNNCYQLPNCCWCYFYCLTIKIATKYCCYWLYYKYLIATTIILPISGHVLLNCTYAMLQPNKLLIVVLVLLPIQFIMSITSLTPNQPTSAMSCCHHQWKKRPPLPSSLTHNCNPNSCASSLFITYTPAITTNSWLLSRVGYYFHPIHNVFHSSPRPPTCRLTSK